MELYIYSKERQLIGIIEAFEYLRWTRKYSFVGSFELKAIANDNNLSLLKIGNILWKNDDDEAGVIELLELTMQENEYITVSGRFVTSFLSRRIIWGTETLKGDISSCVQTLLNNHIISPSDTNRQIENISFNTANLQKNINTQISYKNLLTAISDLCESVDVGIKTAFNPASGAFEVRLYIGDSSLSVFSKEYENIIEQIYTKSVSDYANVALVGGEGEGDARIFVTTGSGENEDRFEIFVDAKDLRTEDFGDDYEDVLTFRGQSKLIEMAMTEAFDVTINQYGNLKYKADFDIGSTIKAISKRWGISMTARITEIDESFDRDGMSLSVTFGKPLLTLSEKLKGGI